jgi:hypothetical protein
MGLHGLRIGVVGQVDTQFQFRIQRLGQPFQRYNHSTAVGQRILGAEHGPYVLGGAEGVNELWHRGPP